MTKDSGHNLRNYGSVTELYAHYINEFHFVNILHWMMNVD